MQKAGYMNTFRLTDCSLRTAAYSFSNRRANVDIAGFSGRAARVSLGSLLGRCSTAQALSKRWTFPARQKTKPAKNAAAFPASRTGSILYLPPAAPPGPEQFHLRIFEEFIVFQHTNDLQKIGLVVIPVHFRPRNQIRQHGAEGNHGINPLGPQDTDALLARRGCLRQRRHDQYLQGRGVPD